MRFEPARQFERGGADGPVVRARDALRPRRLRTWLCWGYVAVGVLLIALYFAVPPVLGISQWETRFVLDLLISGSAVAGLIVGVQKWRPHHVLPWYLLALSQTVYAAGDIAYFSDHYISHIYRFPGLADAFYLGRVPFILTGLVLIVRERNRGNQTALIDSLIVGIGVGAVSWVFLMSPYTNGSLGLSARLASLAYPITDLMLIGIAVRLLTGGGRRQPSFYFLTGGLVLLAATDSLYGWDNLHGVAFSSGSLVEVGWLVYYLTVGACGLHPSMCQLTSPVVRDETSNPRSQILILAFATLVGPVLLTLDTFADRPLNALAISLAAFAITALVILRLARVMRDRDRAQLRFRLLASEAPVGILESTPAEGVRFVNAQVAKITGRPLDQLSGAGWVDAVHPDDIAGLLTKVDRASLDRSRLEARFRILRPDGEARHVQLSAAPVGRLDQGFVATIEDITEEALARNTLNYLAFHDPLTAMPNRSLFLDRLNHELARHRRGDSKIAVLYLDLDRFKLVNDSLGHEAGDAVLSEVGKRLAEAVRPGETAARMGGDEFIFILRNINRSHEAVTVAKRLLEALEPPIHFGGHELTVAASIGIVLPTVNSDASTLLRDADTAMYQAKQGGGNRYSIFDHDLHLRSVRRLALEGELRQALAKHEFEVYYQPVVQTATHRPVSAEALVRWRHPTRGVISPDEFISIADESGLIKPLGRWVYDKALSQLAEWDGNVDGPHLDVLAVNFSARQLDDPETSGEIRAALEHYRTDPARICIEITESLLIDDGAAVRRTLGRLASLGLRIAIDDFGTGYSSLSNLHRLPISTVKIDRSFVETIDSEDDSTPVIKAIVEMSHALGLRVVAEGVSSARLDDCVANLGCDLAQGFYWAQPMPATEFLAWWKKAQRRAARLVSVA